MAKKIRFPLNLAEDKQARDLTELREFFSLPDVLGYVADGKLVTWLTDRYETELAEQISALDTTDPDFVQKVCEVLGVEYQDKGITLEDAQARNEKLAKLKEFIDDKAILDAVDSVAFEQDDIYDLLDEDCKIIYLCGEKFSVPLKVEGMTYIGVNQPIVVISSKEVVDFEEKKIVFRDVVFDEGYQGLLDDKLELQQDKPNKKPTQYIQGNSCVARADAVSVLDANGARTTVDITNTILVNGAEIEFDYQCSWDTEVRLIDVSLSYDGTSIRIDFLSVTGLKLSDILPAELVSDPEGLLEFIRLRATVLAHQDANVPLVKFIPFMLIDDPKGIKTLDN